MFDFSLPELMVIMVVALVVIGPERLPKVARTMGHLYGRARRYVNGVKADISRDLAIDEFKQLQQKAQAEASALQSSIQQAGRAVDEQVGQLNRAVSSSMMQPLAATAKPADAPVAPLPDKPVISVPPAAKDAAPATGAASHSSGAES